MFWFSWKNDQKTFSSNKSWETKQNEFRSKKGQMIQWIVLVFALVFRKGEKRRRHNLRMKKGTLLTMCVSSTLPKWAGWMLWNISNKINKTIISICCLTSKDRTITMRNHSNVLSSLPLKNTWIAFLFFSSLFRLLKIIPYWKNH